MKYFLIALLFAFYYSVTTLVFNRSLCWHKWNRHANGYDIVCEKCGKEECGYGSFR